MEDATPVTPPTDFVSHEYTHKNHVDVRATGDYLCRSYCKITPEYLTGCRIYKTEKWCRSSIKT